MDIDIKETLNAMILSRIGYYNLTGLHELYAQAGSATQIIEASGDIKQLIPEATPRLVKAFKNAESHRKWAESELQWDLDNGIKPLAISSHSILSAWLNVLMLL